MKFDVPLMMPAIHSMRFAASPSRSSLMIGMPPPTEPSKATITPFFCAAAKISVPWVASSALLAVTTCLPLRIASSTSSFAMLVPPISSTMMSISASRTTRKASDRTFAFLPTLFRALPTALSATCEMRIARPARRWISSALRLSTSQVPPPTVPMPSSPTLIGFISFQAELKVMPDVPPFGCEHAVHHGIAHRAVAPRPVVPEHPVLLRAQRFDRALRTEIEVVGPQAHDLAYERLDRMSEKQQLADRVHVRALAALRVPGVADLDAVGGRDDVVIAGAADNLADLKLAHRPRQHVAVPLPLQRLFDIDVGLLGLGHGGEPQFPQSSIGRCACQLFSVQMGKRLELHPVTLQGDRSRLDQAAPRSSPSLRNMSRIPRAAWRRRCSFSISAMRT